MRLGIARTLLFGWPAYLLVGLTGSERRGRSNHFWPVQPFDTELFPARWHRRVWASAAGVAVVVGLLAIVPQLETLPDYWERAGRLRAQVIAAGRRARIADVLIAQSSTSRPGRPRDSPHATWTDVSSVRISTMSSS